jgi:hypothetical protein
MSVYAPHSQLTHSSKPDAPRGGGLTNVAADKQANDGAWLRHALYLIRLQLNSSVSWQHASMNGKQVLILIAGLGALIVAVLYMGLEPGNLVALAVVTVFSTWRNRKHRARETAFWTIVWQLRQSSVEDRAQMLAALEPAKLRDEVEAILSRDGTNESQGDVERFPFPFGLRRFATRTYWVMWALGLAMLAASAFVPAPLWLRCVPLVIAACCAYGAWLAGERERSYDSVIEVTPFRVSELFPDGRVHTVLLGRYLELHHEPKHKRLRLTAGSEDSGIALDYRRMGFGRLVDLVVQYGEFQATDSDSPAS